MNINQPHPKAQQQLQQRVLKPVDMNNPSTPCPNKTYRAPSPASGLTKHQLKPKHHQIYLSPSSLAPYHSPSRQHIQPKLKQAIQTPCSHGATNTNFKRNKENQKSLSPNTLASKEVGLHYLPTNVTKKTSPRPNKVLDIQKYMEQTQKSRGGDFSISSTKMAARMKPDRCSTDHLKLHEISSKRQVMTLGDLGKVDEKPVIEINLSPHYGTHRSGLSQIGQGIEMNLSPISKLKEDLSSFLSDKEKMVCIRHPRKKAKYRAKYGGDSGVEYLYCSECAVELAMKGTQIEKLPLIGLHTRTNTECDDRIETEAQEPVEDLEVTAAITEFRSKLGEVIQDVDTIESRYLDYKETTEIKVELTRETIQCCSENVIALFKEETNKTIDGLNTEMNQRMQSIELYLNQLKDFYKGYIDIKQDFEENFQQSAQKISRKSAQDTIQDFYRRVHEIKNKLNKTTQPAQEIENSCFEAKINDYKKGLKAVLKEVINELEREEVTMTEKAAEQPTMTQSITDENMLKKLGAFEDFLRADESQDALQMRTVPIKPKMGDNMVISFGSKEVFDNVLHAPHEGLTICSTQGETMVLPSLEEISSGYRACVTEPALYENPRKGNVHEDYGKFMNYIESKINDQAERVQDSSFQKTLFHSPEFKSNDDDDEEEQEEEEGYEMERRRANNVYYNY